MRLVTTVPVTGVPKYTSLTVSGTVLSLVRRNRVPMATPAAPQRAIEGIKEDVATVKGAHRG